MGKIKIVCDRCGGDHLDFDANVYWNIKLQKWDVVDVYDQYCLDCDDRVPCDEIKIYPIPKEILIL